MKPSEAAKIPEAINQMFAEVSRFSVIALTGRTGSGCSTAARLLSSAKLPLPETGASHFQGNEARKYRIIKDYIDEKWNPFLWLQVKSIITRFILELNYNSFVRLVADTLGKEDAEVKLSLDKGKSHYDEMHRIISEFKILPEKDPSDVQKKKSAGYDLYYTKLPSYARDLRDLLNNIASGAYTAVYQRVGDNNAPPAEQIALNFRRKRCSCSQPL